MRSIIITKLNEQIKSLKNDCEYYFERVYGYDDEPYASVEKVEDRYYMSVDTIGLTEDDLRDLHSALETYHDELNDIEERFDGEQCIEFEEFIDFNYALKELVDKVEDIVYNADLIDYLNFDVNDNAMDILNDEYGLEATEDRLEQFLQLSQDDAVEKQGDLFEENKHLLVELNGILNKLLVQYENLLASI